jgi:hypothetical protein
MPCHLQEITMPEMLASPSEKIRLALALQSVAMRHSAVAIKLHSVATRLLEEAEPQAWNDRQRMQSAEERVRELEQRADPDHDGRPYADTLGH